MTAIIQQDSVYIDSHKVSDQFAILNHIGELLDQVYLKDLPESATMEYGAIRGYLSTLNDPLTFFIDPPVAQSESQSLAGNYGGISVKLERSEFGEYIIFPFDDGPGFRAGLRNGDLLIKINDELVQSDMPLELVEQLLRGEIVNENGVEISVKNMEGQIKTQFIKFETINIPSVLSHLVDDTSYNLGYVQILKFTSRTPTELREELEKLLDQGIRGLIIDLRDNSGGLLIESVEIADLFLDSGNILVEKTKNTTKIFSSDDSLLVSKNIPIIILVNDRTASASEIVASALRDNDRAILLGQRTYGKGTVQQIFPLTDGSSVHITTAEWYTPKENTISQVGLEPDIPIALAENGDDPSYSEAIKYLKRLLQNP